MIAFVTSERRKTSALHLILPREIRFLVDYIHDLMQVRRQMGVGIADIHIVVPAVSQTRGVKLRLDFKVPVRVKLSSHCSAINVRVLFLQKKLRAMSREQVPE